MYCIVYCCVLMWNKEQTTYHMKERNNTMELTNREWNQIDHEHGQKNAINISSLYTKLIQEAGKCDFYASDILTDIDSIEKSIAYFNGETITHYIGFRDMGTDHESFINCRESDYQYRKVYKVTVSKSDRYDDYIAVTLYEMKG